ncbi:uncharacterized protein LOC114301222 [Camellia sinensis]|uniref:uncharacterized protein LOC114301222 n=1 Tax=Camellia sinensis TaxID=4442 RepID=UPI0010367705|nr:uncharacterized protein LOC114301222 [Camellia sinensis]
MYLKPSQKELELLLLPLLLLLQFVHLSSQSLFLLTQLLLELLELSQRKVCISVSFFLLFYGALVLIYNSFFGVGGAGASQGDSSQKVQALNLLKRKQQQQKKRKLLFDLEEEIPEVRIGETEAEQEETEKEQETPLKRKKKMTVSLSDFTRDPIHEASAKAVEVEHSKELIVFQRAEKRRQQQMLRDEVAAADALQREVARQQKNCWTLYSSQLSDHSHYFLNHNNSFAFSFDKDSFSFN